MPKKVIDHEEFREHLSKLVTELQRRDITIDAIVGLARGGFHLAAYLAEALKISGQYLIGLPAYRVGSDYHVGALVNLGDFTGLTVLVVDDATVRGVLIQNAKRLVLAHGAKEVHTCAMIAAKAETQPDFIAEIADIPDFYWEV